MTLDVRADDLVAMEATPLPVDRPALPDRAQDDSAATQLQWKATTRVAFRFCFAYFGMFCLGTQILLTMLGITGLFTLLKIGPEVLPETAMRWIQLMGTEQRAFDR